MTISEYLSDHINVIAARTVFAVAAALFLMATGTQTGIIVILGIFWALLFFGMQIMDFLRCRSYLQELEGIMDGLDKKYLFAECAPNSRRAYERRTMDLFRRAGRAMTTAVSDAEASIREYREYVESWVHEMKAPITA
ncbi:MAG: sensor histidine kinase, partial [Lachnospiraceae bacterium]|nr:sensor histidine kinase [Lachnospiraceae bacterium]